MIEPEVAALMVTDCALVYDPLPGLNSGEAVCADAAFVEPQIRQAAQTSSPRELFFDARTIRLAIMVSPDTRTIQVGITMMPT